MNLPFVDSIKRADRDNAIDVYMGDDYMDVLADGRWEKTFSKASCNSPLRKKGPGWTP